MMQVKHQPMQTSVPIRNLYIQIFGIYDKHTLAI